MELSPLMALHTLGNLVANNTYRVASSLAKRLNALVKCLPQCAYPTLNDLAFLASRNTGHSAKASDKQNVPYTICCLLATLRLVDTILPTATRRKQLHTSKLLNGRNCAAHLASTLHSSPTSSHSPRPRAYGHGQHAVLVLKPKATGSTLRSVHHFSNPASRAVMRTFCRFWPCTFFPSGRRRKMTSTRLTPRKLSRAPPPAQETVPQETLRVQALNFQHAAPTAR